MIKIIKFILLLIPIIIIVIGLIAFLNKQYLAIINIPLGLYLIKIWK